jgi:hypothetical protein
MAAKAAVVRLIARFVRNRARLKVSHRLLTATTQTLQPSTLAAFFVFNPTLGDDDTEGEKILYFHPPSVPLDQQKDFVGISGQKLPLRACPGGAVCACALAVCRGHLRGAGRRRTRRRGR